jgi:hypothetical protein
MRQEIIRLVAEPLQAEKGMTSNLELTEYFGSMSQLMMQMYGQVHKTRNIDRRSRVVRKQYVAGRSSFAINYRPTDAD